MERETKATDKASPERRISTASAVLPSGAIVEMVYDPEARSTSFSVWQNGSHRKEASISLPSGRLVPFSASNNLVRNEVVLFPSNPEEYDDEETLVSEIQNFIHRYVDTSDLFERIASYYVLFSWIYDGFNELPYLRVRGDTGSGKTRFLLTIGSLCYKPIFASGASTASPVFRILDIFRGTLIIDEGDFRMSDEKAEIVKILNNGNARGFSVLRSEVSSKGEYNPTSYTVFGPKIVATRGYFDDRALESRFLTEEVGQTALRRDIPINLPPEHKEEARQLRNKLLLFRFRNYGRCKPVDGLLDRNIEPRLNQIFSPLLSIIGSDAVRDELKDLARQYHENLVTERGQDTEAQVLEVIKGADPLGGALTIGEIATRFADIHGEDYDHRITPRWMGHFVRTHLRLTTVKRHGTFVIAETERPKLERLFVKYGLGERESGEDGRVDLGTWGTSSGE